jgi:ApeA N-terminal domain 1
VNRVRIGTDQPDAVFSSVRLGIHGLLQFLGESGLSLTGETGAPDHNAPVSIAWKPVTTPTATVGSDVVAVLSEHRVTGTDFELGLEDHVEVELRGEPRTFDEWRDLAGAIEGFIAFLTDLPVWIERFYTWDEDEAVDELWIYREGRAQADRSEPWIPLAGIQAEFEEALRGWAALSESDNAAFVILNEYLRFGGRLLHEDRLLYLARFVELYHRDKARFDQPITPKATHKQRMKEILDAVPREHHEFLKEGLAWSNEKNLRTRLDEIIQSFDGVLDPIAPEEFAAYVTDNRNYLTHYSEKTKKAGRVLVEVDLHYLVVRLFLVVRACVLREMGFSNDAIGKLLMRDRSFFRLARAPLRDTVS